MNAYHAGLKFKHRRMRLGVIEVIRKLIMFLSILIVMTGCSIVTDDDLDTLKEEMKQEIKKEIKNELMNDFERELENFRVGLEDFLVSELIIPDEEQGSTKDYIELGMSKNEVIDIMGTPDKITNAETMFIYGKSSVNFDMLKGLVNGWDNTGGNLKLK